MNSTGGKGPLPAGVATSTGTSVPSVDLIVVLLSSTTWAKAGAASADAKMAPAMTCLFMVLSCRSYGLHSRPAHPVSCAVQTYPEGHEYPNAYACPSGHKCASGHGFLEGHTQ